MSKFILLSLIFSVIGFAAGDSHNSSGLSTLIPAILNVGILFSVLYFILADNLRKYFREYSDEVVNEIERAKIKKQDAEIVLKKYSNKLSSFEQEVKEMKKHFAHTFENYVSQMEKLESEKIRALNSSTETIIKNLEQEFKRSLVRNTFEKIESKLLEDAQSNREVSNKIYDNLLGKIIK